MVVHRGQGLLSRVYHGEIMNILETEEENKWKQRQN